MILLLTEEWSLASPGLSGEIAEEQANVCEITQV